MPSWTKPITALAITSLAVFALIACSSPQNRGPCQEPDWYEIGRRRGAQGQPLGDVAGEGQTCPDSDRELQSALYRNGHDRGLIEYCTPELGFELGRTGAEFKEICPQPLAQAFLKSYLAGARSYQLEKANQAIDQEIADIFRELASEKEDKPNSKELRSRIRSLRQNRAKNDQQLDSIESSSVN